MEYDPISEVIDKPLAISEKTIKQLSEFKAADKFLDLPGHDTREEKDRLSKLIDSLIDNISKGIQNNPTKLWVMERFQPILETASDEDTEGREHFAEHLAMIMDILEIESSDGLLGFYLE